MGNTMRFLKLTIITLISISIHAQQSVQIDMHGGKDIKTPSHFTTQKPKSMHELLRPNTKQKDNNQTQELK